MIQKFDFGFLDYGHFRQEVHTASSFGHTWITMHYVRKSNFDC